MTTQKKKSRILHAKGLHLTTRLRATMDEIMSSLVAGTNPVVTDIAEKNHITATVFSRAVKEVGILRSEGERKATVWHWAGDRFHPETDIPRLVAAYQSHTDQKRAKRLAAEKKAKLEPKSPPTPPPPPAPEPTPAPGAKPVSVGAARVLEEMTILRNDNLEFRSVLQIVLERLVNLENLCLSSFASIFQVQTEHHQTLNNLYLELGGKPK